MPLHVEVVTQTGSIYSNDDADEVVAPGSEGQLGILPRHAPLMTTLNIGALRVKHGGTEETIFIGGGFMEVYNDEVTILADDAARAADIDEAAAEEARKRAQTLLDQRGSDTDTALLQGQIEQAIGRLRVAEVHRQRRRRPDLPTPE